MGHLRTIPNGTVKFRTEDKPSYSGMVIEQNTVSQQECKNTKPISNDELCHEDDDSRNDFALPKKAIAIESIVKNEKKSNASNAA
jgi:hypothetical protein